MPESPAGGLGEPRITTQHIAVGHRYRAGVPGARRRRPHHPDPGRGPERGEEVGRRQVVEEQRAPHRRVQPGLIEPGERVAIHGHEDPPIRREIEHGVAVPALLAEYVGQRP